MFDGPFDFFALVFALIIAVIAFIIAIKASSQAAELRRRLSSLEETFHAQRPVQPPLIPADVWAEAPATTSAAPPPLVPEAEASPPLVTQDVSPPPLAASTEADAPPPLPAPAPGFELLGLVALGTLAAALLHGPALAGLGVVGAFVTPILVSSDKPDYWALYIYLAIVTAASFG